MQSSKFTRFSAVLMIVVIFVLAGLNSINVKAGPLAQSTAAATMVGTQTGTIFAVCPPPSAGGAAATTEPTTVGPTATAIVSTNTNRPYLGLQLDTVDNCGLRISGIRLDGPASKTTLRMDDLIVAIDCIAIPDLGRVISANAGSVSATAAATMAATLSSAAMTPTQGGCQPLQQAGIAATMNVGTMQAASIPNDNGMTIRNLFVAYLNMHHPGDTVVLTIQRGSTQWNIPVTLAPFPTS